MVLPSFEQSDGSGTTGRDDGQCTHGASDNAPDLFEWGQHPGPDGDVGCEVGDRLVRVPDKRQPDRSDSRHEASEGSSQDCARQGHPQYECEGS